jgi:hypothetical protein
MWRIPEEGPSLAYCCEPTNAKHGGQTHSGGVGDGGCIGPIGSLKDDKVPVPLNWKGTPAPDKEAGVKVSKEAQEQC